MEKGDILNELERAKDRNDRLAPLFERQNRNVLNAVVEIQYLLGNGPTRVDPWLKQLNRRLEVALDPNLPLDVTKPGLSSSARAKAQAYFAGWRTRQTTGHDKNYAHLLSNELARMEKESGFTHQQAPWSWPWTTTKTTTPKVPYMVSVVSAKTFEFQLLNSQHWKDVGVSAMHGEYTHRIQWYVISAARVVPAPAKIMSELAHYPPNGLNQSALWDCLFDRARSDASGDRILFKAESAIDFRCPEHFNEYLTQDESVDKLPLLSAFLRARKQKRTDAFYLPDYVSAKSFGKPFDRLNARDQQYVRDLLDPTKEQGILREKVRI